MDLNTRIKNRKLKNKIESILSILKFKTTNLDFSEKLILFASVIVFLSLFTNWIWSQDLNLWWVQINWNSFSSILWSPWIIIIVIIFYLLFNILSIKKKEKLKKFSNLYFKNHKIYIVSWILITFFSLNSINYISWLKILSSNIIYGQWIILCATWWILIIIGWVIKKINTKENLKSFLNEDENSNDELINENEKNNMKLPF